MKRTVIGVGAIILLVALGLVGWRLREPEVAAVPTEAEGFVDTARPTPVSTPEPSAPQPTITPTPQPTPTTTPEPQTIPAKVALTVPFVSQAPFGDWADPRQQDGCEEASVLMAVRWAKQQSLSKDEALKEIHALAAWQEEHIGTYHDTSVADTLRLVKEYFDYERAEVRYDITKDDIRRELAAGHVVAVPAQGQLLGNPNFTPPGPPRHFLVIRGYDDTKQQFITNDPGTRRGEAYRYDYDVLMNAIVDYPTGHHEPITNERTAMIVVRR